MDDFRQFPAIGQSGGLGQLHAFKIGGAVIFCNIQCRFVATINFLLEAGHPTVADLDCVLVEDLVKHVIFRELFIVDLEKSLPNI